MAWTAAPDGPDTGRWSLCRTFGHGQLGAAARLLQPGAGQKTRGPVAGLIMSAAGLSEMQTFSDRFGQRMQLRHDADYNHLQVFARSEALQAVSEARVVIDALDAVHGQPAWQAFTALVLLKSSVIDR